MLYVDKLQYITATSLFDEMIGDRVFESFWYDASVCASAKNCHACVNETGLRFDEGWCWAYMAE